MRMLLWAAFFLVSNVVGVEVFKAAMTLPRDEALLPGLLTVLLVGMAALAVTRVLDAWESREK